MLDIIQVQASVKDPTLMSIFYSVVLTFVLAVMVAKVYQMTFQGLSYSRNFVQSLILGSLVTCIAMQAIGDNMARGFGMMGALAIIRFRSSIKDPKDIIFIFAALTIGIAAGVYQFRIAALGAMGFCGVALFLFHFPFVAGLKYDGLVRFSAPSGDGTTEEALRPVMTKHCKEFALVTLRELAQGQRAEFAYQVKLRENGSFEAFLASLKNIPGVTGVTMLLQESTVEI